MNKAGLKHQCSRPALFTWRAPAMFARIALPPALQFLNIN